MYDWFCSEWSVKKSNASNPYWLAKTFSHKITAKNCTKHKSNDNDFKQTVQPVFVIAFPHSASFAHNKVFVIPVGLWEGKCTWHKNNNELKA